MAPDPPPGRPRLGVPVGVFVGLTTLDVLHRVERSPGPNEKVTALRQDVAAGGPATNAAVVFAAMGGTARLITSMGSDPLAAVIRAELTGRGVQTIDVTPDDPGPPAISSVAITQGTGDRSVISIDAGARVVQAPEFLQSLLSGAEVVLIDGHHPELALAAARCARAAHIPVVVDAGRWKPVMAELLPMADDVICSADFRWPGTTHPDDSAAAIRASGTPERSATPGRPGTPRLVAVTHGSAPIRWWQGVESGTVPVPAVAVVDTLGAGDALHGGYAFLRTDPGRSVTDRLAGAARVAALRCSVAGPREWLRALPSLHLAATRDASEMTPSDSPAHPWTGQDLP